MKRPGETTKAIALMRYMPKGFLQAALRFAENEQWPFSAEGLSNKVMAYGGEAIVYEYGAKELVIKRYWPRDTISQDIARYRAMYNMHKDCFGELVVNTQMLIAKNVHSARPSIVMIQPRISGEDMLGSLDKAPHEQLWLVRSGIEKMYDTYGCAPDLNYGNILLSRDGIAHIVDFGVTYDPHTLAQGHPLHGRLERLMGYESVVPVSAAA